MQFSHALILAFVASVVAQTGTIDGDVAALPDCAKKCIDKATLDAGCKTITDYECQCGSAYGKIAAAAGTCVASSCPSSDLPKTLAITTEICALVKAGGSSSGGDSSSSSASAPSSTGDSSETSKPTETGGSSTDAGSSSTDSSAPTTTGGDEAPSSTGESAPSSTDGGAAPSSSTGAAATGSWNFAAAMAGAGVVAAGLL